MPTRREFLVGAAATMAAGLAGADAAQQQGRRPNVVLIITDDQGYGDLACHGNPHLKTPHIDRLYSESVRFTRFHVSPVCSPTRASLMTGRYNYRTGVIDTYQGRSMMRPDEVTVAQMLGGAGYRTGLFGKWHLGDNYPMRCCDRGFQESLSHKGGGICQPSEPRNNTYFDTVLSRNGVETQSSGYCTDVFTAAAVDFIRANREQPFFAYLATNAPHVPLDVAARYAQPYLDAGLDEQTAKLYGMIANLDENVGRLMACLRELNLESDTILIFMTDNGAQPVREHPRHNGGARGFKGGVYEGGIRVPFFVRWPGRITGGRDVARFAAHIDITPTLLELCGVEAPAGVRFDGRSMAPLLTAADAPWPERTLFFQWHRGDVPERYNNCAALTPRFKLVDGRELYDLEADFAEEHDIAAEHPDVVRRLRQEYEAWFDDVCARGFEPPRIIIGTPHESPTLLSRQDWRGCESWHDAHVGYWELGVAAAGRYAVRVEFPAAAKAGTAHCRFQGTEWQQPIAAGATECSFEALPFEKRDGRFEAWTETDTTSGVSIAAIRLMA